jgi:putative copper resistance protein D
VTQLLDIFGFLSVVLRGMALSFEALTTGGLVFVLAAAVSVAERDVVDRSFRWLIGAAAILAITQLSLAAANSAILIGTTDLQPMEIAGAEFWRATLVIVAGAVTIIILASGRWRATAALLACLCVLAGSTLLSHSAGRVEYRWLLMALTLAHHAGGRGVDRRLPYLLVALRHTTDSVTADRLTSRFSRVAMASVALLTSAGAGLGIVYVGSAAALGGTTYGAMLLAKVVLTGVL